MAIDLADRLAVSGRNEVCVSSGDTPGITAFGLQAGGTLIFLREFFLGDEPVLLLPCDSEDDIEKIVFKV